MSTVDDDEDPPPIKVRDRREDRVEMVVNVVREEVEKGGGRRRAACGDRPKRLIACRGHKPTTGPPMWLEWQAARAAQLQSHLACRRDGYGGKPPCATRVMLLPTDDGVVAGVRDALVRPIIIAREAECWPMTEGGTSGRPAVIVLFGMHPLIGLISCVAVSLIMCTGGPQRPDLHERHLGRHLASRSAYPMAYGSHRPSRAVEALGYGCAGPP
jgi:hypothetical protein